MKSSLPLVFGALLALSGCGKSPGSNNAADSLPKREPPASPKVVRPIVASDNSDTNAILAQLTEALRKFTLEQGRMPTNVEEVVAAGYIRGTPQAPQGKKFAVDPKNFRVVIVKK